MVSNSEQCFFLALQLFIKQHKFNVFAFLYEVAIFIAVTKLDLNSA